MKQVGRYAFLAGLAIAVIAGLGFEQPWFTWLLAALGLVVGLMNITDEQTNEFLLSGIGLMLTATAVQSIPLVGETITHMVENLAVFVGGAVFIVAVLHLFRTARD